MNKESVSKKPAARKPAKKKKENQRKWLPWAVVIGAVVVVVVVLLVWNPPFVQGILGGGEEAGPQKGKVVAKVGSSKLTVDEYQTLLDIYVPPEQQQQVDPTQIINAWIEQEIVYRHAEKMNLARKDTVKDALEQLRFAYQINRKQLLTQAWLAEESKNINVSEQELRDYFSQHKDEFLYEIKVSQIVVQDPIQATQIYQQLQEGADFGQLAQRYTLDQLKGEPTSYIPRGSGMMTLRMEEQVFSLEPGQITEPIVSPQGLAMIFKMVDKRKVRKDIPFQEVASYLQSMLTNERAEQVIAQKVDSLRKAAQPQIEIHIENLLYE